MGLNPSWPVIEESIAFLNNPNTLLLGYVPITGGGNSYTLLTNPAEGGIWCDITARTEGTWASQRGRQYQLDQIQTGTVQSSLRNDDGAFDPSNTSSPFYPLVQLYRGYRRRAQAASSSVNLLYPDTAEGFGKWGWGLPSWTTINPAYPVVPNGNYAGVNTVPNTIPAGTPLATVGGFAVAPGTTYTGQLAVALASGSPSVQMQAVFNFYLSNGTISTSVGTVVTCTSTHGSQLFVTGTAPANCVGATLSAIVAVAPASTVTINQLEFWQVQVGAVATSWKQPAWSDLFTGYVSGWPQTWGPGGNYGTTNLQAVDAFGYLSQGKIFSPAYMDVLSSGAEWFWPLDEPSSTPAWLDLTGNAAPAQTLLLNGAPATQCQSGQELPISLTTGLSSTGGFSYVANSFNPAGVSGPCTQFSNYGTAGAALLNLAAAKGQAGFPATSGWTLTFLVYTPAATAPIADQVVWAAYDTATGGGNQLLQLRVTNGNFYEFDVRPASGTTYTLQLASGAPIYVSQSAGGADGCWHAIIIVMSADGKTLTGCFDEWPNVTLTSATDMRPTFPAASGETIGGRTNGAGAPIGGWSGYLSCVGQILTPLLNAPSFGILGAYGLGVDNSFDPPGIGAIQASMTLTSTTTSWFGLQGGNQASSGTRYRDVLRWAGWRGLRQVDNYWVNQTVQYGPPKDMLSSASGGGTDPVSAGQTVVDTENGEHFVNASGAVVFHRRAYRYAQTTPAVVFGENVAGGEIPYTLAAFDFDPARIADDIQLTQETSQITYRYVNQTAVNNYGDLPLQRTVNTLSVYEIDDAGEYLLAENANPNQRLDSIIIDLAANPSAWSAVLGLELGVPVRVMRRPPNAPPIVFNGFIEQIAWSITDMGQAQCTLQMSPNLALAQQVATFNTSRFSPRSGACTLTCGAPDTSLTVVTTAGQPTFTTAAAAYPLTITVDSEQITLNSAPSGATSPQTFTGCTRGVNGTTAASHSGSTVSLVNVGLFVY